MNKINLNPVEDAGGSSKKDYSDFTVFGNCLHCKYEETPTIDSPCNECFTRPSSPRWEPKESDEKPKFKVGDSVRILEYTKVPRDEAPHWVPEMDSYVGKVGKITKTGTLGDVTVYRVFDWHWHPARALEDDEDEDDGTVKVGDMVRYTGETTDDVTRGELYKVFYIYESGTIIIRTGHRVIDYYIKPSSYERISSTSTTRSEQQ